jgi:transposase-like protein
MFCEEGEIMSRRPHRNHSPAFKSKVALVVIGEMTLTDLAQHFDVHANQAATRKRSAGGGCAAF